MSRPKVQNKCRDYNNIKIVLLMSMIHINYLETQAWHLGRRNINKLMSKTFYKPSSCGTVRKLKNLVFPSFLRNLLKKKNAGRRKIILAKEKYCLKLSWKKKNAVTGKMKNVIPLQEDTEGKKEDPNAPDHLVFLLIK